MQVSPFFWPVTGGVENHVWYLSRYLVAAGHDVTVLTSDRDHDGRRIVRTQDEVGGVQVLRFPIRMKVGTFGNFWPGLFGTLCARDMNLIHTHVYRHPHSALALAAAKLRDIPCLLTGHSPFHPLTVRSAALADLTRLYDASLGRLMTRWYDTIIAITSSEAEEYHRLGASKRRIEVIPNGVPTEAFERVNDEGQDRPFFLYLGRLHPTKGLEFLIRSFAQVSTENSSVRLWIVGDGPSTYHAHLSRLVSRLNLEGRVIFTGSVDENRKRRILASCACLILPSVYEPFGIVLLEAMAQGKPVIATSLGGPKDIVHDGTTGYLVEYGDEESLATRMLDLLNCQSASQLMGQRAREYAKQFAWDKVAERIVSVYSALVS